MEKPVRTRGSAASSLPLPLASLRLLASPLQLAYAYIWQVIQKRNVRRYDKVEEFVTMVTQTVPELMSTKQTAQLLLGLRARIILELVKEATPDCPAVQALINKLKISAGKDVDVEKSQTNFMVLVQILLKNTAERQRFFQEVFPVQYGTKYDTALQALIAGLVYKLEQLLPVPNLSQVCSLTSAPESNQPDSGELGTMIPSQPSVLEESGHFIPDHGDLKVLLRHQKQKGYLTTSAISSTVGDCVLSSLSFLPDPLEPTGQGEPRAAPDTSDPEDPEDPEAEEEVTPGGTDGSAVSGAGANARESPVDAPVKLADGGGGVPESLSAAAHAPPREACATPGGAAVAGGESHDTAQLESPPARVMDVEDATAQQEIATTTAPETAADPLSRLTERSVPFRVMHVPVGSAPSIPVDGDAQRRLQIQRVTLHQWVSQMATNSLSLPTLPPLSPPRAGSAGGGGGGGRLIARRDRQRRSKSPAERFTCDTCGKRFAYQSKLTDHRRIHTGEKPFACAACGKGFRTQAFLNTHLPIHSAARPYSCGHCGRCFHRMPSMKKHMLTHSVPKPFYCGVCDKGFTQSTYFKRHMECHASRSSFPCGECPKAFPTEFKLANHRRWHTRDRPHMCERCGKRFLVPSLLKRHMGYHVGERQYLCAQCGKTFVYLSDLKRHQKDHGPKTKLPCHVCHKKFSSKYCLRIHTRIHTREKPYTCPVCDKSFTQIGNLKVHVRLHNDERPYSCEQCGKSYKLTSHLNAHKRTHLFKKPWTCGTCGKGFSLPGLLKKHEQLHLRDAAGYSGKRPHRSKTPSHKRRYEEEEEEEEEEDGGSRDVY